jgi:hypothetical protein
MDTSELQDKIDSIKETASAVVPADSDAAPFSFSKVLGVALVGAVGSLAVYYIYNQLEAETRQKIRSGAMDAVKGQVRSFVS